MITQVEITTSVKEMEALKKVVRNKFYLYDPKWITPDRVVLDIEYHYEGQQVVIIKEEIPEVLEANGLKDFEVELFEG
jgi:hypothetical protein